MLSIKVIELLHDYSIDLKNKNLLCCVSGGADSMALLSFFYINKDSFGLQNVIACHLNHCARGKESDRDEEFVRRFCSEREIPFYAERIDSLPDSIGLKKTEDFFRQCRYEFFDRVKKIVSADYIATAHTANDNAETVLFRIARGSGFKGVAGIPAVRDDIIRPLLYASRNDTENYCIKNGIGFVNDSSNDSDDYSRNIIRHHIIPVLISINSKAIENIQRFSNTCGKTDIIFKQTAESFIKEHSSIKGIEISSFLSRPEIIREYIIYEVISSYVNEVSAETIERCKNIIEGGGKTEIAKDLYFTSDGTRFTVKPKHFTEQVGPIPYEDLVDYKGEPYFSYRDDIVFDEGTVRDLFYYCVDYDKLYGVASVRNRRAGDSFHCAYRDHTKSLKKIFNEKKYTSEEKDEILILTDDSGIIWVENEGPAKGKEIDNNTKRVIIFNTL